MDLSGAQFGNYAMTRTTPEVPGRDSVEYNLYRQHPDEDGVIYDPSSLVGTATVSPSKPSRGRTRIPKPDEYTDEYHAAAAYYGRDAALFEHQSWRASDQMTYLTTTKADRHMGPTIAAVAARDSALAGREMTPDDSLSRHSHRMLGHLEQLGAAAPHRWTGDNGLDFRAPTPVGHRGGLEGLGEYIHTHQDMLNGEQFIPKTEVRSGQRAIRAMLPRHPRSQGEQGTLF